MGFIPVVKYDYFSLELHGHCMVIALMVCIRVASIDTSEVVLSGVSCSTIKLAVLFLLLLLLLSLHSAFANASYIYMGRVSASAMTSYRHH